MPAQKSKVTIFDVAKASGVSSSAVSYALNGKPGVSEETRAKVLDIARELGWKPNGAAQALAKARTRRIGLVLGYDPKLLAVESYMMELLSGLSAELERHDYALLLRMAVGRDAKIAIIKDWIATGSVDGLLLLNLEIGDPNVELLKGHPEMPVLALADPSLTGGLPTLSSDDAGAVDMAMRYLAELGHTRVARVAGPEALGHSYIRDAAFSQITAELGITYRCLHTDYTPESGAEATKLLLSLTPRPTAIIYDNDVMALSGLGVATGAGVSVPGELSLMSWDDSFMCTAAYPNITAMGRDVVGSGRQAAQLLLKLVDGGEVGCVEESPYQLRARASTAAPQA
ncbi:LacI family transcriptional regulator [Bifidobacterium lemurum]|uniref:LacI family transcriptional regulator n=1 Tax=Bifidobacterium lemurum TaxID=1603886 RepID=A0A261FV41_9BIFI|nr:LacI family DNA-binding transcriptional regulator [Bifidobacterium lemurum]OZG62835.1 LacI family transcriptional regulator [Bifidobacterium lemurum]QOL35165.1 LacI family DNA-binding transcriptional regulator [Bifidobacterium lemurum]